MPNYQKSWLWVHPHPKLNYLKMLTFPVDNTPGSSKLAFNNIWVDETFKTVKLSC
jgi:hypothetical protein